MKNFFFILFFAFVNLYSFTLSKKTVIVQTHKSTSFDISANELKTYLKKIFHHDIMMVSKPTKSSIILLKLSKNRIKDDGFIIKTYKNKLIIASNSDRGIINAVYYFLDRYAGCKFLSKDFEYIPHYTSKRFKNIFDKQEPTFSYREIFITEADDLSFSFKLLLNGRLGHRITQENSNPLHKLTIDTHSFISSEILDKKFECDGQYEYGNPKAQEQASSILTKKLKILSKKQINYALLEHEDRGSTCGGTPQKDFLRYTTYIANSLSKKFPNIKFYHQAYFWSKKAPDGKYKLPNNLGVLYSPIEANFYYPLNSKQNKTLWDDLLSWTGKSSDILVWHYITDFNSYLTPYPDINAISKDLKEFKKLGFVKGVFLQGSYGGEGGYLSELKTWIFAKLLWNPNQDTDKLIREFCRYYYGTNYKYATKYIKTLYSLARKSSPHLDAKSSLKTSFITKSNIKILYAILDEGLKKIDKNSIYHRHYLKLYFGLDIIAVLNSFNLPNKKFIQQRAIKYLQSHPNIESFSETLDRDTLLKLLKLQRIKAEAPKEAQGKKWIEYQEYQLELCCAKIVEDKKASDKVSAIMDGSSGEWGFSLTLSDIPKGSWDIYASVKISLNKNLSITDMARWALKYGIEPDINRGIKFVKQISIDSYTTIKIGSFNTSKKKAKYMWISPPKNNIVKKLYLDRVFLIKKDSS